MKKRALLIGIDEYTDESIQTLRGTENDAFEMAQFLRGSCGFDQAQDLRGRRATLANVIQALNQLSSGMAPEDLFLFFFAGHYYEHEQRGHLLLLREALRTTLKYILHDVLPVSDLPRFVTGCLPCQRLIFLLDACPPPLDVTRSGAPAPMGEIDKSDLAALAESGGGRDIRVMYSCSPGQEALELPDLRAGAFTRAFTSAAEALLERGEAVSLDQTLFEAIQMHMAGLLRARGYSPDAQRPCYQGRADALLLSAESHSASR